MSFPRKSIIAISLFFLSVLSFCFVYWLKMPYNFLPQRQIAADLIACVNEEKFEEAFELTQKSIYTGKTLGRFRDKARLEIRGSGYQFAYAHPPQSNGNRLRRWLRGSEVEMRDVSMEFRGPSLLRITVSNVGNNQWKVSYITSHAE